MWFPRQQKELFRFHAGFQDNDYFAAYIETDDHVENNKTSSREDTGIIERNRNNGSNTSSYQPHYTTDTWQGPKHITSVVVLLSTT